MGDDDGPAVAVRGVHQDRLQIGAGGRIETAGRLVGGFALKGSDELNQIDLKTAEVPRRSETAFGRMTSELQLGLTMIRHTRSTHN